MPVNRIVTLRTDLDPWAYRASATDETPQDIPSIAAAGGKYEAETYAIPIWINGLSQVNLTAKITGGDPSAIGPVDFYVLLYDDADNIPTKESFVMRVDVTGDVPQLTPRSVRVKHRWMRILKVVNDDPTCAATAVNLLVTSAG
jgi:hypothetical protein